MEKMLKTQQMPSSETFDHVKTIALVYDCIYPFWLVNAGKKI